MLGAQVNAFDFATFHATLGSMPTIPDHPAILLFDFLGIQAATKPFTLAALRAEINKTALNKAISARANSYYAKYANAPAIIARMNELYNPHNDGSKSRRLEVLRQHSQRQYDILQKAYINDGLTGVVKTTFSNLKSKTESTGNMATYAHNVEEGLQNLVSSNEAGGVVTVKVQPPRSEPESGDPLYTAWTNPQINHSYNQGSSRTSTKSQGETSEDQSITNYSYSYKVPYIENLAQYQRAQISLIDEQFSQFMADQNLPHLGAVFFNELNMIHSDVFRMQIAYLNTILMSPIAGTVTGIYKNPGDAIRPGEPVIRVENNADILLIAILKYRGPITIGSNVTIKTTLFDMSDLSTTIEGNVVAVRGQREADQWEVIVKSNNLDHRGNPIFPLGYQFDSEDTAVFIR